MTTKASRPAESAGDSQVSSVYSLLTDGSTVEIRPVTPADAEAVRSMHAKLSPDNLYLRFFSLSPCSAEREAKRLCQPPQPGHAALLAWMDGRLIGVASYEPAGEPGMAEVAFAVPDDMHHRGIATLLLEHLVSTARGEGLTALTATTLVENAAMLKVFADAGLPVQRSIAYGEVQLTFPLPGEDDRGADRYRAAVARRESCADVASLQFVLAPRSLAVIGASRRPGTVGRSILHNVTHSEYPGPVYAVNPHGQSMEGIHCVASVEDLPEAPDLAVIAAPAPAVAAVADACGRRGVRALVVVTAGLGTDGADLLAICRRYGMRLVGPNCLGIMVPGAGLNASFTARAARPGTAGVVVQSGGVGVALLEHLTRLGIGVSSFVSAGDKYDVSSNDLLNWWEQDGITRLGLLYVESFGSPRKFARTARRVSRNFPVLTVIGGRSAAGQSAAASPTAAVTTQEALFGQAGIIAATSLGELVEAAALLASQPLPAGNRVAVVSNAGGAGVLAADACAESGLVMARLSATTRRRLVGLLPAGAVLTGPVDTTAAVSPSAFAACLQQITADAGVDAVLAVTVPTAISDLAGVVADSVLAKPLAAVVLGQPESVRLDAGAQAQEDPSASSALPVSPLTSPALIRVPVYAYPENAARALGHAARYQIWRSRQDSPAPELDNLRPAVARELVQRYLTARPSGGWMPTAQACELLSCYGIPVVSTVAATREEEALEAAARLGGRVVLKAEAKDVVHKSDVGAVQLDLRTPAEVSEAYRDLVARFGPRLHRVLIQPMLSEGTEVIAGVVQDPVFGPLVVFGPGGVATDVLGGHAARLAPLTRADASDLVAGPHVARLLAGRRGRPPADAGALADLLLRVSRLADDLPEAAELDLNPVIATSHGVCAVDVRIRVIRSVRRDPFLRQLR